MKNYNLKYTQNDLKMIMTRYNHGGDGKITYDEFCQELECRT